MHLPYISLSIQWVVAKELKMCPDTDVAIFNNRVDFLSYKVKCL